LGLTACAPAAPAAPTATPVPPAATTGLAIAPAPSPVVSPSPVVKPAASPSAAASPAAAAKPTAGSSPVAAAAPGGSAQHGEQVYTSIGCYACHGTVGQGASTGPRLAPNPIPFEAFQQQVRQPRQDMPRYAPQFLSDQDLADIYAYMQSIQPGPQATSIPLLNP
jgi:mono/diheme cytochrome c family protein